MKLRVLTILAIWIAGNSCYSFSQREIQVSESNQSYLGVQIRDITSSEVDNLKLSQEAGVYVVRVEEDSPAAKADLREGDVIIQFGTLSVFSVRQFMRLVSETPVGRQLELVIIRQGQRTSKTVTLDERGFSERYRFPGSRGIEIPRDFLRGFQDWFRREPRRDSSSDRPRLGIRGEELTDQLGEALGVPGKEGVLITEVTPDSSAQRAGLRAGDVIISVDGQPVRRVSDLSRHLRSGSIELEIIRDKQPRKITAEIESRGNQRRRSMRL
ncbi:PDZ domain-containing protein [Acidobacteria bacterium AH-259-D05]|nr:PDZ domain-containing protein [Acidobacteria bacterium AH-259-D05]